jgi:hypothetical protein
MDGKTVPLVYQHNHTDVNQVLGHVKLSAKDDGVWGDAFLNETDSAKNADILVKHGDIDKFSIWAKDLVEHGLDVMHGEIQEASLVLAGANSGASIFNVLAHSGIDQDDLLIVGGEIKHADAAVEDKPKTEDKPEGDKPEDKPAESSDKTVGDVLDTLDDDQKLAVNTFIDDVVKEAVTEALTKDAADNNNLEHDDISKKGTQPVSRNQFEHAANGGSNTPSLKHSDVTSVLTAAKGSPQEGVRGFNETNAIGSLREFVRGTKGKELMHADTYGVDNIDILFPDAQNLMARPTFVDRRQEWVRKFLAGTSHSPFSRVKTMHADITADEARARGYIKGTEKTEEVFPVFKRTTGPAWIIKMQKLDRQDIIDIVDFDVVAWMKVEMRGKLDEEIARAALFGDNRPTMVNGELNPAKIPDPGAANNSGDGIRAIIDDADLYVTRFDVPLPASPTGTEWNVLLDTVTENQEFYMGSGNKTAFMSYRIATRLLTIRDDFGHRVYRNLGEVAGDMDVSSIERVPTELMPADVLCIILDLRDYNFGTNRGGEVTLFDDFDIKFNQYLYLIETYLSGALTLPYSAQVYRSVLSTDTLVVPQEPAVAANVITVPTQPGVTWTRTDTGATVANGSTITLDADTLPVVELEAHPTNGYYFGSDLDSVDSFTFEYQA